MLLVRSDLIRLNLHQGRALTDHGNQEETRRNREATYGFRIGAIWIPLRVTVLAIITSRLGKNPEYT